MFWHRLALAMCEPSVRVLRQKIDSREFAEWMAFDRLDPIGNERADLHAGIVASTIANCHRGKSQRAYVPADFMPKYGEAHKPRKTVAEMEAQFKLFVMMHNAAQAKRRVGG